MRQRLYFGWLVLGICCGWLAGAVGQEPGHFAAQWPEHADRTWVGPDFWANRLQDWRIRSGRLELAEHAGTLPLRTVHLLTRRGNGGPFRLQVHLGVLKTERPISPNAEGGFLIGAGSGLDYRAAALIHHSGGPEAGLLAGIDAQGFLVVRNLEEPKRGQPGAGDRPGPVYFVPLARSEESLGTLGEAVLSLQVEPAANSTCELKLEARNPKSGKQVALSCRVPSASVSGNLGIVSTKSLAPGDNKPGIHGFWFAQFTASGSGLDVSEDHNCGPILSTQYTVSRGVLKLTAQMMPLGPSDTQKVTLESQRDGRWEPIAEEAIRGDSHTATFRVAEWDSTKDTPFRVVYQLRLDGQKRKPYTWEGTIRKDPVDKPVIVVAGFTGNHNCAGGMDVGVFDFAGRIWFPHNEICDAVAKHQPDLLFFSGDQVYEGASPTKADREHLRLDYLYKWYLWCWAFRELARSTPCITIPDDHDVYQGNLWGEGGRATDKDDKGGYVHPAEFVKVVEHTQTDNLPDPVDPRPIEQGIGVYFTQMIYGRVGFAVLEDRKFKSGCNGRVAAATAGRPDHIVDPDFDRRSADVPGVTLLGPRQLKFLHEFAADWRGQEMKIALSQTVFAGMATHHGGNLFRLVADLDSNGWPQTGRNKAIDALRRGFMCHLAGDQHLATLVHHGIDEHRDSIWSFAVPSIANFYPRAWLPEAEGANRWPGAPPHLGDHVDGLGNKVTVYAVTNPTAITGVSTGKEPLVLHDKMPGYGIVRLDKQTRQVTFECWPRYVDPADPTTGSQYAGWPKTISQLDNYARKAAAWLPELEFEGVTDPVVQVINQQSGEIEYTLRIKGTRFRPKVFALGRYTLRVGDPDADNMKVIRDVAATPEQPDKPLRIQW